MKTRSILTISLLLNASLAGAWWVTSRQPAKTVSPKETTVQQSKSTKLLTQPREARVSSDTSPASNLNWASVESDDYRQYIANLRAVGCPEETIRDIIIADINKLYAGRIASLYPSPKDFKFWQPRDRSNRESEREREQSIRDLEREKRDLIKELLGIDLETEMAKLTGRPDEDAWRYGFLSPEKEQQVRALIDKYRDQERALFRDGSDWRDPQNRAKFMALRAQREAEMAQLLTPQEFQEYELRNSWTARNMRENLSSFNPTESEFKQIFDLKKGFDDQFGFFRGGTDDAVRQQRDEAQQKLDDQLLAMLGDERFKQYQLSQDESYRNLHDFMQRNNLPTQMAETLNQVRRLFDNERQRVLSDPNLQPSEKTAILADLSLRTKTELSQSLGQDFQRYQEVGGGRWLNPSSDSARRDSGGPPSESDRWRRR